MKKTIKKISTMLLSFAMVVNLSPASKLALFAGETETDTPAATESAETTAPKDAEKPAAKPSEEPSKEATKPAEKDEEPAAETTKETPKPEAETSKDTEAAKDTDDADEPAAEDPDETEIPEEPEESDADIPDETEEPADKAPVESDKPEADEPETNESDKKTPDESDAEEAKDYDYAEIPNIKIENGILSWDAIEGVTSYDIDIFGYSGYYWWYTDDSTITSINLKKLIDIGIKKDYLDKPKDGKYTFTLYAHKDSQSAKYDGTYTYKSSAKPYRIGKISGVKYSKGKLSWKKYSGASKYAISIEDFKGELRFSSNSYNINKLIDQYINERRIYKRNSYRISVYAYDKDDVYMAYWNGTIKYQSKATPSELPAIDAKIEGDTLSWQSYSGADYYTIRIVCPDLSWEHYWISNPCNLKDLIAYMIEEYGLKEYSSYTIELTAEKYYADLPLAEWIGTYKYKEPNTLKVSSKNPKVKYNKKKNKTVKRASAIKITDAGQGDITYKKVSGNSKFTINSKTGNITIKKKLKKKTYTIKVKVIAAGDETTALLEKVLTIKIKLK